MRATSGTSDNTRVGDAFPALELTATSGQLVPIPDPAGNFVSTRTDEHVNCCHR